jgi:AraC-like DNA-binding protein
MKPARSDAAYFSRQVTNTRRFFYPDWKSRISDVTEAGTEVMEGGQALIGGGCEWCAPDFCVERERFPFLALEFVWRGRGTVRLNGVLHTLQPGTVFVLDPTIAHRIESEREQPLVKFFFNFHAPAMTAFLQRLGVNPGELWQVQDPARVAGLLDEAIDHALTGSALGDLAAWHSTLHALSLCVLLRGHAAGNSAAHASFLRCRDYLLRRYPQLSSVDQAAVACGMTASYMTRLFQRYADETPHHCLQRLKMTQALLLLRQPRTQVKAVAHELGFKSAAHFSRCFTAWHGMPPSAVAQPAGE